MPQRLPLQIEIFALLLLIIIGNVNAKDLCNGDELDQTSMNQCTHSDYIKVEADLNSLVAEIVNLYKEDENFIAAFKESQKNWQKQLELDLRMRFPEEDSRFQYGSIFPVCYYIHRTALTQNRINYLQEWITGHEAGEICGGSVMHEFYFEDSNETEVSE